MIDRTKTALELIDLSNWLGAPEQDCAILGEGNTSARISDTSFLVKSSGTELRSLTSEGLVEIDFSRVMTIVEDQTIDDDGIRQALLNSRVNTQDERLPSVETPLHAICLALDGVNFVGHTHPTSVNSITCSKVFVAALEHRLFPDEVVVCGREPLLVRYADPGVELARVVQRKIETYISRLGTHPRAIYLQNHGLIALGSSAKQVRNITAMAVKAARILIGTNAFGGAHPMTDADINRIDSRQDEHYRQRVIEN